LTNITECQMPSCENMVQDGDASKHGGARGLSPHHVAYYV